MIIDESIMYMGIVILGGLVLVAGVFFIIKTTPKKSVARNDSANNAVPNPGLKESVAFENQQRSEGKPSFFSRLKGKVGGGFRGGVKGPPSPNGQPEPAVSEQRPSRMPDLDSLGLQPTDLQSQAERETLSAGPVNQVESAPELPPAPPAEPAPLPDTEPPVGEKDSLNAIDDLPVEEAEPGQDPPPEEAEIPVQELSAEEAPADNQQSKTDDLFDMFKDEMAEESEVSKFAANLDDIDAHDLLEQSQSLINYLSGHGDG